MNFSIITIYVYFITESWTVWLSYNGHKREPYVKHYFLKIVINPLETDNCSDKVMYATISNLIHSCSLIYSFMLIHSCSFINKQIIT